MAYHVGGDVDANCTKCKMELAHVIVAIVDNRPKRVQCKTCSSVHNYRSANDASAASKRSASKKSTAASTPKNYETLMSGKDISSAQRYRVTEAFVEGIVVDHKKFGLGLVTKVLGDAKIEVTFRSGTKTLIHQRPSNVS